MDKLLLAPRMHVHAVELQHAIPVGHIDCHSHVPMAVVEELESSGALCIYSDGSGEDGSVGAAAVASDPLSGALLAHRAHLGALTEHTVFEGELYGILLALRILRELRTVRDLAYILFDNQAAITRTHTPRAKSGQCITSAILEEAEQLRAQRPDLRLTLVWVPGHEGVEGNELADLHAKKGSAGDDSEDAELDDELLPTSAAALRASFKQYTLTRWRERWAKSERGQRYSRFDSSPPSARVARAYHGLKRADAAALTQLRTGHVALNAYLHRITAIDSPLCTRCNEPETVDHFLLRCPRFLVQRGTLRSQLKGQVLSTRAVLGSPRNLAAVMTYINATGRLVSGSARATQTQT